MSFKKYPDYLYEFLVQTGEVPLGTYTVDRDGEITYIYLTLLVRGLSLLTDEEVYVRAVRSSFPAIPIQSNNVLVTSFVEGLQSWIGRVRFDFTGQALTANDTIDLYLGTNNYSSVDGGVEVGAVLNYIDTSTGQFSVVANRGAYLNLFADR